LYFLISRYDAHAADLLFQVVSRRYEQKSIVVTTNLAFKEWNTIFPNASCAVALIDRLTHHAEILTIEGDSYRKREAELAQRARRAST
jgi:DNA replication protein DnaC